MAKSSIMQTRRPREVPLNGLHEYGSEESSWLVCGQTPQMRNPEDIGNVLIKKAKRER